MKESDKRIKEYWSNNWKGLKKSPMNTHEADFKRKILKKIFERFNGKKIDILEIGCGNGSWLIEAKKLYPNSTLYGYDISETALEICKKKGIKAYNEDCRKIKSKRKFDVVLSFGVIEHYPPQETEMAFKEHYRVTKEGGTLWIDVPNKDSLPNIAEELSKRIHRISREKHLAEWGRRHTWNELARMAISCDLFCVRYTVCVGPVLPYSDIKIIGALDRLMPDWIRIRFGGCLGIVIKKR